MRLIILTLFLLANTISFAQEKEQALTWPREIEEKEYTITLYQSQLESFEGNILKGRMALSIKNKEEDIIFRPSGSSSSVHYNNPIRFDKANEQTKKQPKQLDEINNCVNASLENQI